MKSFKRIALLLPICMAALIIGCGGSQQNTKQGSPIDPSGNWSLTLTDSTNRTLFMSALFSQTGSVVSASNVLAVGNPAPFSCTPFTASLANGQVLNVDQFSGDIITPFGNVHFDSTLNPGGTHSQGTYTLTGNCWNVASTGTFSADEIPSVAGNWTGAVNCIENCPTGPITGTISMTLTQDDVTGAVAGSYAITGLPNISSGSVATGQSDVLSGSNWQDSLSDAIGNKYVIAGGPFQQLQQPGLGTNRTFGGLIFELRDIDPQTTALAKYSVTMNH
jgi:hypothetical protein